jgi:hypothetical protein
MRPANLTPIDRKWARSSACGVGPTLAPLDAMTIKWKLILFAVVGFALGASCGGDAPLTGNLGNGGTFGNDAANDTTCLYQHYFAPGCGPEVAPRCTGAGGACASMACGCSGKIIGGCANEFAEPYAYTIPGNIDGGGTIGMTCDPESDAGK